MVDCVLKKRETGWFLCICFWAFGCWLKIRHSFWFGGALHLHMEKTILGVHLFFWIRKEVGTNDLEIDEI